MHDAALLRALIGIQGVSSQKRRHTANPVLNRSPFGGRHEARSVIHGRPGRPDDLSALPTGNRKLRKLRSSRLVRAIVPQIGQHGFGVTRALPGPRGAGHAGHSSLPCNPHGMALYKGMKPRESAGAALRHGMAARSIVCGSPAIAL